MLRCAAPYMICWTTTIKKMYCQRLIRNWSDDRFHGLSPYRLLSVPKFKPELPTPHPSKMEDVQTVGDSSKFKFDSMSISSLKRYASRSSLMSTVSNVRNKIPVRTRILVLISFAIRFPIVLLPLMVFDSPIYLGLVGSCLLKAQGYKLIKYFPFEIDDGQFL